MTVRHGAPIQERIVALLKTAPRTTRQVASILDIAPKRASAAIKNCVRAGLVERIDDNEPKATYGLVEGPRQRAHIRFTEFRELEEEYIEARRRGEAKEELQQRLQLTDNALRAFEQRLAYQTGGYNQPDSSTPKFANNDDHLDGLLSCGGYPALYEKRGPWPRAVVTGPLYWPVLAAQAAEQGEAA